VVVLIPIVTMGPQLLLRSERHSRKLTRAERAALPPSRLEQFVVRMAPYAPSEMYRRAAIAAAASPLDAAVPLGSLALIAAAVQAAGFGVYRRVLDMPVSLGTRRAGAFGGLWNRVVPRLTPGASAVALTQLRLGLRTPRGRASMVTPLLMCLVFGAVIYRGVGVPIPGLDTRNGIGLAVVGLIVSILALLPLAMNQFAIDKAGFTRYMLSPLSVGELLIGKAVGNALIGVGPAAFCFIVAALVFRGGNPALWLALFFSMISTYVLVAPAAAALSATFPRTVDLNSIGHASNAHQAAALLGLVSFFVSAAPCAILVLIATRLLHQPSLAPVFVGVWCALALVIARLLFGPVRKLVASRCEALAQYY
jgi:hypothetical protein